MINKDLRIAVVNGGPSAEAEVSRSSARGVIEALKQNYPQVASLELNSQLATALEEFSTDVVFPVLHGPPGEDGTFQGFLETLNYAYVGSDVHSSAFAMDKIIAKSIFRDAGLAVIEQTVVKRSDGTSAATEKILADIGDSVVVKPARQGSAIGISLVENKSQLYDALEAAFTFDERLLIEARVNGKEITVGVLDTDDGCQAFPVIEVITPENSWYDFEHRYTQGLSTHVMPADIPQSRLEKLQKIAVDAHQALGCRDLSRADFIVTEEQEYLLEVNTLPGMTPTSLYPEGALGHGLSFVELVSYLVERAKKRRF